MMIVFFYVRLLKVFWSTTDGSHGLSKQLGTLSTSRAKYFQSEHLSNWKWSTMDYTFFNELHLNLIKNLHAMMTLIFSLNIGLCPSHITNLILSPDRVFYCSNQPIDNFLARLTIRSFTSYWNIVKLSKSPA